MKTLGERLKESRESAGMTQIDVAGFAGITPAAVSMIEAGQREPQAGTLKKLCEVLGTSSDYVLGLADKPCDFVVNQHAKVLLKRMIATLDSP
jgi:transcriptional regulator with XRE-family HTH domain